jgi:hypothetical protein
MGGVVGAWKFCGIVRQKALSKCDHIGIERLSGPKDVRRMRERGGRCA